MIFLFPFEKLKVWIKSKELAILIYSQCDSFPNTELYGLRTQMQRSAISISSNIAEGNSRKNAADRIKFFNIAFTSLMELISQSVIAYELGLLEKETYFKLRETGTEIANMLTSLANKQKD